MLQKIVCHDTLNFEFLTLNFVVWAATLSRHKGLLALNAQPSTLIPHIPGLSLFA